jgi:ABC-2 type transport system permease protein
MTGARLTGAGASWLRIRAVARRHAYVMLRSPHRLFDVALWPVVDVLLFGSIGVFVAGGADAGQMGPGRAAFGYLLAGVVLWHVVYQAQIALSTGFLEETWSRNLLNLLVTPLREIEYAAGVALFGFVKLAIGVGLVLVVVVGLYAFDVTELGLAALPIVAILLLVGWTIALFVIALVLRFGSGAEALAWGIVFVVMPLSGVFYPVEALPRFLRPLALLLPTTYAFAAGRALLDGLGVPWALIGQAAATALASAAVAAAFLARMLRAFRRRGYVTRYS